MKRYYIICSDVESAWRRVRLIFPTQTTTTRYCLNFTNKQFILLAQYENTSDLDLDDCYHIYNPTYYAYSEENMDMMIDWIIDKIKEIDEEEKKDAMNILGQTMPKLTFPTVMWIVPIKKVIFNDPATIVMWEDGTKTVVKTNNEEFDPEKGLAMAISKKVLGNGYHKTFKHWIKED